MLFFFNNKGDYQFCNSVYNYQEQADAEAETADLYIQEEVEGGCQKDQAEKDQL